MSRKKLKRPLAATERKIVYPLIQNILNAVIAVAGIVAVIFIVKGGFDYMTSSGDAGKVQKAKQTILYAVIGLIICALSFAIVNFVIIGLLGQNSADEESTSLINLSNIIM